MGGTETERKLSRGWDKKSVCAFPYKQYGAGV